MRKVLLAAIFSAALLVAPSVQAQVSYGYGSGAYPNYPGMYAGGSFGYGGVYGPQNYGSYAPGGYVARPYLGPALLPSAGVVNGGLTYLPQTPINNNPYYSGYTRYAQYGLRRAGGGRVFGTYVPRDYGVYQPRPGGLFDR